MMRFVQRGGAMRECRNRFGWCVVCMLAWATQALAGGGDARQPGFDRTVRSQLQVTNQRASGLGPHTMTIRNTSAMTLRIEPRLVDQWPKSGNGIDVELGPLRLEPNAKQDVRYTISTNDASDSDPFRMIRRYTLQVSADDAPTSTTQVPLVLSATLHPAELVRVRTPAVGPAGSYVCAAAELEHLPQPLWPVHCRNTAAAAQAGAYPLELHLSEADPLQHAYLHSLRLDHLYRTRYVDGSTEPLNCASSCTIDFARGRNLFDYLPTRPELAHELEPLLEGLPRISRRMLGEEPDVVLEVERRPDLMDPMTRVDTIQAVCIGNDCGSGTIVIDAIDRIDDVGHGFAAPPRGEVRRYAPDGQLQAGMILSPAGPRDRAELAWRITDQSGGAYVESHYEIRYHAGDGRPRRLVSPGFGGILEPPAPGAAREPAPALRVPPWAFDQLPGPFLRMEMRDSSSAPSVRYWTTPPLPSQVRLFTVLLPSGEGVATRISSGTLVGLPQLRGDRSVDSFKVLTALHALVPIFYNGLTVDEYLSLYDAPIEVVLSDAWFDDAVETPDPTGAALETGFEFLGRSFHSARNAMVEVSAPHLPIPGALRLPDVLLLTIHPAEHLLAMDSALAGVAALEFAIAEQPRALDMQTSMFGFAGAARYIVSRPGAWPTLLFPMVQAPLPALRDTLPSAARFHVPFNAHSLRLGTAGQFLHTRLDPVSAADIESANHSRVFGGLSGSAVLSDLVWEGGALQRAVVRAVVSAGSIDPTTDERELHVIGLDADTSVEAGQDYHAWLQSHIP